MFRAIVPRGGQSGKGASGARENGQRVNARAGDIVMLFGHIGVIETIAAYSL